MAQQTLPRIDRATRAAGIVSRQECIPVETVDGLFQVRDSATGSGAWHLATATSCDCMDASRGHQCKHQRACQAEAIALAQYAAAWDTHAQPRCPMCGAELVERQFYTGGRGWSFVEVCSGDATHSNRRG